MVCNLQKHSRDNPYYTPVPAKDSCTSQNCPDSKRTEYLEHSSRFISAYPVIRYGIGGVIAYREVTCKRPVNVPQRSCTKDVERTLAGHCPPQDKDRITERLRNGTSSFYLEPSYSILGQGRADVNTCLGSN